MNKRGHSMLRASANRRDALTRRAGILAVLLSGTAGTAWADPITQFTPGDLVISTVSCSVGATICNSTSGGLDTASTITLQEFSLATGGTVATSVGTFALPQTANGANS